MSPSTPRIPTKRGAVRRFHFCTKKDRPRFFTPPRHHRRRDSTGARFGETAAENGATTSRARMLVEALRPQDEFHAPHVRRAGGPRLLAGAEAASDRSSRIPAPIPVFDLIRAPFPSLLFPSYATDASAGVLACGKRPFGKGNETSCRRGWCFRLCSPSPRPGETSSSPLFRVRRSCRGSRSARRSRGAPSRSLQPGRLSV